jgi:tRNA modification GTPase
MSGPAAHSILRKVFRSRKKVRALVSHRLYLGFVFNPETMRDVDEVLVVSMGKPRTYTREQMAEIYSHGSLAAQRLILALLLKNGARLAEPGEFTKRAFLNGRIDLAQAESVLHVIESESEDELRHALMHVKGLLSEAINAAKKQITRLLAEVEAQIDFPEEEIELRAEEWASRLRAVRGELARLISSYYEGRAIRQGLEVLIVGRTNVGKSSLLNALAVRERAIVTPLPGTTRDLVEDTILVKGVKFRIIDTAGLRKPKDPIEEEGIARVRKRIPLADMVLWVIDASEPYTAEDEEVYQTIKGKETIAVLNKADLPGRLGEEVASKSLMRVSVSALTGSGIEALKEGLYRVFTATGHAGSSLLVTSVRHRDVLEKTAEALERAAHCSITDGPIEFLAFELRDSLARLGEITGETCTDELLNDIFSRFCIGK